jgi:dienelactone hydrolase
MQIEERQNSGEFDRCLISYQVEKEERIHAYLLIPHGKGPFPAIVACHQHNDEYHIGKSEPAGICENPANTFALTFCNHGFVVICPDHLCFEERRPSPEQRENNHFLENGNYERLVFMNYILRDSSLQTKYISDLCRAVDVLENLPEVNPGKIGVCGHSLGGLEAFWLGWYERRIRCVMSSCGFAQLDVLQKHDINHNYAMYLPGLLAKGDYSDILALMCPKPVMMSFGREDQLFPMDAVNIMLEQAGAAYQAAGFKDRFKPVIFEGGHGFSEEMQIAAIEFFNKSM